jgi:hypothetical protein
MSEIPNTKAYREWAEGVLSGQVVAGGKFGAEVVIELLDYIEHLEGLVDSGCGAIDVMGVPGRMDVLNAARANEQRRRDTRP